MNTYLKKFIDSEFDRPGKALDLGAGDFFDVVCLKQLKWQCEGVDIKTGVDLEKPYLSPRRPFDLVYSNYLIHKLKNKKQLIKTVFNNLKSGGWFFLHTFDKSDPNSRSTITAKSIENLLNKESFKSIGTRIFSYYDNEEGHKHWHRILEVTAQKQEA